jgi:hypothetical protein
MFERGKVQDATNEAKVLNSIEGRDRMEVDEQTLKTACEVIVAVHNGNGLINIVQLSSHTPKAQQTA